MLIKTKQVKHLYSTNPNPKSSGGIEHYKNLKMYNTTSINCNLISSGFIENTPSNPDVELLRTIYSMHAQKTDENEQTTKIIEQA